MYVSFPTKSSNLTVCNNSVWVGFQPNFYLLCVVCLQRLHEGNSQNLQCMSAVRGKVNNVHPVLPRAVYIPDIPRMRIATIQCEDNRIFQKTEKMFETLLNLLAPELFF